ncbi:hypothetical protein [Mangrovibacillus cuniculi]|uniref:Lipoprotein n=1 Tax=Mangrovibacillus cuniculi TaxID=2593652 RepID=A0A7S8HGR7_9BACI|nr:hypothetical protein [Mangrovibacillus cuniculi]QPC48274.1 hypothetical protein G8O30_15785 [Mangrovibacillus cuniculi]
MKKFLILIASIIVLVGCTKEEQAQPIEKETPVVEEPSNRKQDEEEKKQ